MKWELPAVIVVDAETEGEAIDKGLAIAQGAEGEIIAQGSPRPLGN